MKSIKLIIVALMLTLSTSLFASLGTDAVSNAGFSDLTEQQQAEIIKTITDKKAEASQVAQTSAVDEAQKWADTLIKDCQDLESGRERYARLDK